MYGHMGGASILSIPGVRIIAAYLLAQMGLYPVRYYGLVSGASSSLASANTSRFVALYATAAARADAMIVFDGATYSLNACALTAAVPSGAQISLEGQGRNGSILRFYGTHGPFLNFSPASGSLQRWQMRGFLIQHDSLSTGACLQFSSAVSNANLVDVEVASGGFLVAIQSAHATNMFIERCKINTRTDYADLVSGALTPVALDLVNSGTMGGLFIHHTELGAVQKGANPAAYGTILRCNNSGTIDSILITGCHFIGGAVGIHKGSSTGQVANVIVGDSYVADTEIAVQVEPGNSGAGDDVYNWQFTGVWMSGRTYNVLVTTSNGGTPSTFTFIGCYMNDATNTGVFIGPGVNYVTLIGNQILTSINTAGRAGVEIGDGSTASESITVVGNTIRVGSSADASYKIGSAVDGVTVAYNTSRGVAGTFNGATDASRVHVAGAFLA